MALPLKSGADLYNNQALRLRLHNLGADPTEVGAGLIYFNTSTGLNTSKKVRLYTGSAWKTIAFSEDLDVASNADFLALKERVDLLSGDVDTDAIISNMKEVSAFLEGFAEDASLMDLLNGKLDKAGGEIKNTDINILTINRNEGGAVSSIAFKYSDSLLYGYLGFDDVNNPIWMDSAYNRFPLLHSGNVGDYALRYYGTNMPADIVNYVGYGKIETGWKEYGPAITFGISNYYTQIQRRLNTKEYYVRGYDNGTYTDWKTIAFTDSNVASATKLETPRTIWGQRFDGTENVDGSLAITNGSLTLTKGQILRFHNAADNTHIEAISFRGDSFHIGYGNRGLYDTYMQGNNIVFRPGAGIEAMRINSSGNVTIGGSDLAGTSAKLYVDGDIHLGIAKLCSIGAPYSSSDPTLYNRISIDNATDGIKYYSGGWAGNASYISHEFIVGMNNTSALAITNGGNVGIGTTEPYCLLEVAAIHKDINPINIAASANFAIGKHKDDGLFIGHDYTKRGSWIQSAYYGTEANPSNAHTYKLFLNPLGGNVLIGTTDDNGAKLNVGGRIEATGSITTKDRLEVYGSQPYIDFHYGNSTKDYTTRLIEQTKGTLKLVGNIHVTGNIIADGEVSVGGRAEEGGNAGGGGAAEKITATIEVGLKFKEISHTLGDNVIVQVYEWNANGQTWDMVLTDVETTTNLVTVRFGNETDVPHKVVII